MSQLLLVSPLPTPPAPPQPNAVQWTGTDPQPIVDMLRVFILQPGNTDPLSEPTIANDPDGGITISFTYGTPGYEVVYSVHLEQGDVWIPGTLTWQTPMTGIPHWKFATSYEVVERF